MKTALILAFGLTAVIYASVGFGGGSTYTALLAATGTPYVLVPIVSLACNITVVSGSSARFAAEGLIRWGRLWPILACSVPAAWWGGRLQIPETVFFALLCACLTFAGLRLLFAQPRPDTETRSVGTLQTAGAGMAIGFLSGLVGIGGGILLAPLLYFLKWGRVREIAAAASVFILANSLAGLLGQVQKHAEPGNAVLLEAVQYWPLILAVAVGGSLGNHLNIRNLSPNLIRRLTGGLILLAVIRILTL